MRASRQLLQCCVNTACHKRTSRAALRHYLALSPRGCNHAHVCKVYVTCLGGCPIPLCLLPSMSVSVPSSSPRTGLYFIHKVGLEKNTGGIYFPTHPVQLENSDTIFPTSGWFYFRFSITLRRSYEATFKVKCTFRFVQFSSNLQPFHSLEEEDIV